MAILAGGQSRRMGQNKAFLPVGGRPVIERVLERVGSLSDDVTLVTNSPDTYRHLGCRMVGDVYPGKGSLGGIYTAVHAAGYTHCLVVACDMPFLNIDLLCHLFKLASGFDVVVPRVEGFPETMHAVYGKGCLKTIERCILEDQLKIVAFLDHVRVRYLERDEVARFDPTFRSFLNMNSPEDWERLQKMAQSE